MSHLGEGITILERVNLLSLMNLLLCLNPFKYKKILTIGKQSFITIVIRAYKFKNYILNIPTNIKH